MNVKKINCSSVNYRKGVIEITACIHNEHINFEVWSIHPDVNLLESDLTDDDFPDNAVTGNTEIELNLYDAQRLVKLLSEAIAEVERVQRGHTL
jgi:hypothetical protein